MVERTPLALIQRSLLDRLKQVLPDLKVRPRRRGIEFRWKRGRILLGEDGFVAPGLSRRRRAEMVASGQSFFDAGTGLLHLNGEGVYVHLVIPPAPEKVTVLECTLLAALCEARAGLMTWPLPGPDADLRRYLESLLGIGLTAMAISRLSARLRRLGVIEQGSQGRQLLRKEGLMLVRESFRLGSVGPAHRFAVEGLDRIQALVDAHHPSCIHGIAEILSREGVRLDERDLLASKDLLPAVRRELGAPVRKEYEGPVVEVRFPSRVPVPALASVTDPRTLSPILGAITCIGRDGVIREAGEALWRRCLA